VWAHRDEHPGRTANRHARTAERQVHQARIIGPDYQGAALNPSRVRVRHSPGRHKVPATELAFQALRLSPIVQTPGHALPPLFPPFRLLSIPTIFPDGGSFLFSFTASSIRLFTPGRFTSSGLRSFTLRTPLAFPSSSFSGSGSSAPRKNASVTCSFPSTKTQRGPSESKAGVFHGLT